MKSQKFKWALIRIFLMSIGFLSTVSLGTLLYIMAPVTSYVFFNDWRFWRYVNRFHQVALAGCYTYIRLFDKKYRHAFSISLTYPPMLGPDRSKVRVRNDWGPGESCGDCCDCCQSIKCPLLNKNGLCGIYGSMIWRYFNCGNFPTCQKEIDYYNCPKWEMIDNPVIKKQSA